MATVARETGWSAEHILWHLPYAMGLGICHCAAVYNGQAVEWVDGRGREANRAEEDVRGQLQAARQRYAQEQAAAKMRAIDEGGREEWQH